MVRLDPSAACHSIMSTHDFCLLLPALRAPFFMRGTPEYITSESAIDIRWFADGLTRSFEEIGFESHSKDA